MSIAAISSQFASSVRRMAAPTATEASEPVRAAPRVAREPGRRHELVAAMNQAMGLDGEQDRATEQAVFRFAHVLMRDLRTLAGEESDGPRAWGRRDWGDLSQRLGALATAASQPAVPAPSPEVLAQPSPLTPTTAAVHIMKVPSSHLLEAFATLQRALGQQSEANAPSDARTALADLARRLATAVQPATAATTPAGTVVDTSA
jgi:hypothetical protein